MKALYSFLLIAVLAVNAVAREPEPDPTADSPNEGSTLQIDSANQIYHFKWWGRTGRTYFIQQTTDLLQPWSWVPVIESGSDSIKDWGFTSTSDKFFVRLKYTEQLTYDPLGDDFDGDGISNILEVQQGSDPFDYYSQPSGVITPLLTLVSGDNQSNVVDQFTAQPVVLLVTNTASTPLVNAPVTFNAGVNALISSTTDSATITNSLVLRTNTQGQAIAYLWFQGEPGSRTISYQPDGHTAPAGTVSATVVAAAPIAPSNITASRTYTDDVQLTWSDNSTNETGFTLTRSDDNGATWTTVADLAANTTTYTLNASNATNTSTRYRAQASNSSGSSASSNQASNVPPKPAPRYALIDLGTEHFGFKIANSGHVLAQGDGSAGGYRWLNGTWESLTGASVQDMNNSGAVIGTYGRLSTGQYIPYYYISSYQGAFWSATDSQASLDASTHGFAYGDNAEDPYHSMPVDQRTYYCIDDNGTIYGSDATSVEPMDTKYTYFTTTGGTLFIEQHSGGICGPERTRIVMASTAGYIIFKLPEDILTFNGTTLSFWPLDMNNDGAIISYYTSLLFHGGSTETLPVSGKAINNRHYPPGDTGAPDWQILSDTALIEKERNEDGSPGANYKAIPITDILDRISTKTYSGFHLVDINDHGTIVATAQKEGTTHAVLLVPLSIVRETEKGSGQYEKLSAMPVFQSDSGAGRGASISVNYDSFEFQVSGNLSSAAIDTMTVSFTNTGGSFSGTLTETGVNTGVFQNSGNTFTLTLSPVVTTSSTVRETLTVLLTSSTLGLNNSTRTVLETASGSSDFTQPQMDVDVRLSAPLSATQSDTLTVSLQGSNFNYSLTVTETALDSKVFQTSDGNFVLTMSNYTGLDSGTVDSFDVTLSGSALGIPFTYHLTERGNDAKVFANFTVTPTSTTPVDPSQSHDGVFYIKIAGTPGQSVPIKLKSGDNEITVQATAPDGATDYLLSPPLLLTGAGSSGGNYSGLTTLAQSSTAAKVEAYIMGSTMASFTAKTRLPAFLGAAMTAGIPAGHWDTLDRIIGRNTTNWMASSTPSKLGYPNSTIDKTLTIADLQAALPKHSIMYLIAHGQASNDTNEQNVFFNGIMVWESPLWTNQTLHLVTPEEISSSVGANEYNLVFLNSCAGANDSLGKATAYADAFKAKNYVSWPVPVVLSSAANSAIDFFNNLDNGKTVSEACKDVKAKQSVGDMGGVLGSTSGDEFNLEVPRKDDSVIIDLTPDEKN